jgi:DNA-binding IclR family transcriptional regulator
MLSQVDLNILEYLHENGSCESLFKLAVHELGLNYSAAWHRLNHLEKLGLVDVKRRGAGYPLVMSMGSQSHKGSHFCVNAVNRQPTTK